MDFIDFPLMEPMMQEVADVARCAVRNDGVICDVIRMASTSAITARSAGNVRKTWT
ncbi:hypothetical protein AB4Y32_29445 [Paraburkholderia phymatum]|uniref:Uncharacterized protein n=1 Tax=Paraburkholderia phymatum TaxID=148447 RepID=A0ACC6U8H8_9BURK